MQSNSQTYCGVECDFDTSDAPTSPNNGENKIDPTKYKTKICRNFANGVPCPFEGRCVFAHGENQLRAGEIEARPLPSYTLAVQEALPPPPYTPYASVPSTPTSPTYVGNFTPVMHQSHSTTSLTRVASSNSLSGSSRPDTPPAYPTHFRHEPYSSGGFVFCEAPNQSIACA